MKKNTEKDGTVTFSKRSDKLRELETREDVLDEGYQIVSRCSDRYSRYVNRLPKRYTLNPSTALQGAFIEHQVMLKKITGKRQLDVIQVRTPEELKLCDALIIPGGG